jgi:hypothetical protein|tara:strand:+ start:1338 stop:2048 length:711 start_codon:yes stop_codon:yes gene_type:complete
MSDMLHDELGITGKIFCISMQRNGTSSVGDFLEQYGLSRAGSPISNRSRWPLRWFDGDFESIFNDETFINTDVLEDDPWWFPEFYKFLYHRFPGSKFILLDRDSTSWFKSMIRHSNGYSLGTTALHAKLYHRENELNWLMENISEFGSQRAQEMILYDKPQHYMGVYKMYNREVRSFFSKVSPSSLFYSSLSDPDLWQNLTKWLNLPNIKGVNDSAHAHKAKGEFTQKHLLLKRNG